MAKAIVLLLLILVTADGCTAQAVQRKHLIITFGGGGGSTSMTSSIDSLGTQGAETGSVRFAFAYALSDKWSFGAHYDRIGSDRTSSAAELLRFTTYMFEATYRPWTGQHAALELQLAVGPSLMALKPWHQGLPYQTQSAALALGFRYLYMFSGTLGAFASADYTASHSANVTDYDGQPITDADDNPLELAWNSQRINAGLVVRF